MSAQKEPPQHAAKPAELLAAIGQADKIVVYDDIPRISLDGRPDPAPILYSSTSPKDIVALKNSIVIEQPGAWFKCACIPPIDISLYRKGREIGFLSIYEDEDGTIGYSHWSGDVHVTDQEKLVKWFDARGIDGPRREMEREHAAEKARAEAAARWLAAMPPDLRPLWPKVLNDPAWWQSPPDADDHGADTLKPALTEEYPDISERIRALFSWFGSGDGPWSGFPGYEDVASHMLLEYSGAQLVMALQSAPLNDAEAEGAARFFTGYAPGQLFRLSENRTLISQLPEDLKKALLDHVAKGGNQDKIERIANAFQMSPN